MKLPHWKRAYRRCWSNYQCRECQSTLSIYHLHWVPMALQHQQHTKCEQPSSKWQVAQQKQNLLFKPARDPVPVYRLFFSFTSVVIYIDFYIAVSGFPNRKSYELSQLLQFLQQRVLTTNQTNNPHSLVHHSPQ
jgi:hypothetical protein